MMQFRDTDLSLFVLNRKVKAAERLGLIVGRGRNQGAEGVTIVLLLYISADVYTSVFTSAKI
jgi:hypothetical protein